MKHYITKYRNEKNELVVVAWLQINFLKWCFCFSEKRLVFKED
ncbi:hypothetical protein LISE100100_00225 [Listeria seeligeri]|nr:hypothetical protein [Listeria seeligeri]